MNRIGVVGLGIVGTAVYEGMKHGVEVVRFDKFKPEVSDVPDLATLVAEVDGPIFICVPTPMYQDGTCNTSIVDSVVQEIADLALANCVNCCGLPKCVVVKSTVPPGTTRRLQTLHHWLWVGFNPEFLTEANPVEDFKNQDRIVLGGEPHVTDFMAEAYKLTYPNVLTMRLNATAAEMVKYVANCFLAMKVSFANEIYQMCEKLGIDYNTVVSTATLDKRLGKSHWKVPGPDGHFGFGLTCFPKDLNAMMRLATSLGVDPKVMKAVWEKNLEVRPEKDWEQMKGRAVL